MLPVALLRRREEVVEDDDVRLSVFGQLDDFLRLSFADEQFRVRFADSDDAGADDFHFERVGQFGEFVDEFFGGRRFLRL